jgi:hypothetical protein
MHPDVSSYAQETALVPNVEEPVALRLLAPQRGITATVEKQKQEQKQKPPFFLRATASTGAGLKADSRKCQTATATPPEAEASDLLCKFAYCEILDIEPEMPVEPALRQAYLLHHRSDPAPVPTVLAKRPCGSQVHRESGHWPWLLIDVQDEMDYER